MKKILIWFLLFSSSIALSMDINGQLKKAQLEVLGSDPTGSAARIYYNSGDATFRYYNGAWRTIVDTSTALSNPMTTQGDIIYENVTPAATRLARSTATTVLHSGTTPSWSAIVDADVDAAAAIAGSKIVAATSSVVGTVSYETTGTFTETFAGPRTQAQHTWTYSRVGKQVTMYWPTDTAGTCGSATIFTGGSTIPAGIIPAVTVIGQVWVEDNGAFPDAPGIINVSSAGAITVSKSNSAANFTASGACTFFRGTFTYTVN